MPILFANTGVQLLCVPLPPGGRLPTVATGTGWQPYEAEDGSRKEPKPYPYLQWQIRQEAAGRLFLAVDTTCGRPQDGYIGDLATLDKDLTIALDLTRLLGRHGRPLGIKRFVELVLRPMGAGDPKKVDMVVDLGNSRTGALLLEPSGDRLANPPLAFGLLNRARLDAWDESGRFDRDGLERWFSSRTHWCTPPYRDPGPVTRIKAQAVKGWFGAEAKPRRWEESVTPDLFRDLSMARLGREADDVTLAMNQGGDLRTGVSSPKRYLWADDAGWLEGADWFMADPFDRFGTGTGAARLQGPLLRYLPEDDRDDLVAADPPPAGPLASEAPLKPRHAPRVLMVAALYELLCQAYTTINSTAYREAAGDPSWPRVLRSLTLTYPSGMVAEERRRLELQARKAARIFHRTLGRDQPDEPHITLEIDEASAVHITYLWSELQMTGLDPALWFTLVGRDTAGAMPPGATGEAGHREVRIACIDIGGGTTDFMIA
ncbi:MAG TPA: virulence factor SrfB, partial [Isosphaeraceae bacterium]